MNGAREKAGVWGGERRGIERDRGEVERGGSGGEGERERPVTILGMRYFGA